MIISRTKAQEAAEALGVSLDGLTSDAISKAYRAHAKLCHPDHHGHKNLQQWARVSWAKDCLTMWLERNPTPTEESQDQVLGDCRACSGTGRVAVAQRGFGRPLTVVCVVCKGLGTVILEENDGD
jgi:DnaJ-class molecular chaperone